MTIMEETVLKEMRKFVGYTDGKGDGIFCPGGSIANGYAINCARFHAFPEVKVSPPKHAPTVKPNERKLKTHLSFKNFK